MTTTLVREPAATTATPMPIRVAPHAGHPIGGGPAGIDNRPTAVIPLGPLTIAFLIEGRDTGGALSMFTFAVPAAAGVPAAHSHDAYEETVVGLEGVLTWTVAGVEMALRPGEVLHIPRGVVHRFENRHPEPARALAVVTPGLLGPDYFRDTAEVVRAAAAAGAPPDPAAIGAVMRRHGLTPA